MALSVGLVGLPNVGKSTIFNALTRAQNAEAANYPFCTIEPNKAVVPVPDERLELLANIAHPKVINHATVEFLDIAGLVKGASTGEGLGNQFLGNIRETAAILHVVRCFENDDVIHVDGSVDPMRDVEIIELELILSDAQTLEKRFFALEKKARADKSARPLIDIGMKLKEHFDAGLPAFTFPEHDDDAAVALFQECHFLTDKPVIYCANVDEACMLEDNVHLAALRAYAEKNNRDIVKICAKMEEELGSLDEAECAEYMDSYGIEESGLDRVIHKAYHTLGLVSYFTAGPKEVRAWTIERGWKAPKAASVIHTDFERGFIRAEVIAYEDYMKNGGEAGSKAAGVMRVEGKEYVVQDGDVMHFLFNV